MMTASCNEAADWAAAGASGGPAAASSWCVNVVPGRRAKAWGQDPNAGRDALSKASFEVGLVEAELLGLFQRIGPQAHRPVVADDLSVRRLVKIFELEQFLRDDDISLHPDHLGDVGRAARAVPRSEARRVGKECVSTVRTRWAP